MQFQVSAEDVLLTGSAFGMSSICYDYPSHARANENGRVLIVAVCPSL